MTIFDDKSQLKPAHSLKKLIHRERSPEARAEELIKFSITCLKEEPVPASAIENTLARLDLVGMPKRYHGPRWRPDIRRMGLVGISASTLLALSGFMWMWHIDQTPSIIIPGHTLPAVNAMDDFKSAGAGIVDNYQIDGAMTQLKQAELKSMPLLSPSDVDKTIVPSIDDPQKKLHYSFKDMQLLVKENRTAIERFQAGISKPYCEPSVRSDSVLFPHLSNYQNLARIVILDSKLKASEGNWDASLKESLDVIQMGIEIPHGGVIINKLVGIHCESTGQQQLWRLIDHLNADQTKKAMARMSSMLQRQVKLSDVIREEKYYNEARLMQIFRSPSWRFEIINEGNNSKEYNPAQLASADVLRFFLDRRYRYTKSELINQMDEYMDRQIKSSEERFDVQNYNRFSPADDNSNLDSLVQILLPVYQGAQFTDLASSKLQNLLLSTSLAIHLYKLDHGRFPATLADLLDGYISEIPRDPFLENSSLKYILDHNNYSLYSVGPDGKDDLGKPIMNITGLSPIRFYNIHPNSQGDVVAGINVDSESSN